MEVNVCILTKQHGPDSKTESLEILTDDYILLFLYSADITDFAIGRAPSIPLLKCYDYSYVPTGDLVLSKRAI